VIGLFLPPEDHGTAVRYVLDPPLPVGNGDDPVTLLRYLVPGHENAIPEAAMAGAYAKRLIAAGVRLPEDARQAADILQKAQQVAGEAGGGASRRTARPAGHGAGPRRQ
jgi:hypothetical protein